MATLDDMEDFRERITKTETGLVVIGGANERLFVSNNKKKFEGITQAMVDRCIADEIHDFVANVLNPSANPIPTPSRSTPTKSSMKSISFQSGVTAIPKPRRKRPAKDRADREKKPGPPKGRPGRKKSKPDPTLPIAKNVENKQPMAEPKPPHSVPTIEKVPHSKPIISIPRLPEPQLVVPKTEVECTPTTSKELPVQATPEKMKSEDNTTPDSNSTLSIGSNESTSNSLNPVNPNQTPKTERHYGLSYGISEMPTVISQSATRTGRQIRAPKSLDV